VSTGAGPRRRPPRDPPRSPRHPSRRAVRLPRAARRRSILAGARRPATVRDRVETRPHLVPTAPGPPVA